MMECPHLGRTSAYFDGALPEAEEAAAVDHLADCAACQGLLRDAATFDAVISEAPVVAKISELATPEVPVVPISNARRKRWPLAVVGFGVAAAAACALWFVQHGPHHDAVQLALAPERAVEARFTGDNFGRHRPYAPLRGDRAHEAVSLDDLAALEREPASLPDLIAGLAVTGNLARANELAGTRTDTGANTDRAALALLAGHPDQAIDLAYLAVEITEGHPDPRSPSAGAAWWNLALAARDLDLPRVSRDAFAHAGRFDDDAWIAESQRQIAALERRIAGDHRDAASLRSRAAADEQAGRHGLAKAERAEAQLIEKP